MKDLCFLYIFLFYQKFPIVGTALACSRGRGKSPKATRHPQWTCFIREVFPPSTGGPGGPMRPRRLVHKRKRPPRLGRVMAILSTQKEKYVRTARPHLEKKRQMKDRVTNVIFITKGIGYCYPLPKVAN